MTKKSSKKNSKSSSSTDPSSIIPATVHMISGCEDRQTSADVSNVDAFSLPDPAGRAGGACTSALLKVLYYMHKSGAPLSFVDVLMNMRGILSEESFSQIPQLTSSRTENVTDTFYIVPPSSTGTKRALLIGINYVGQSGELSGCQNDVMNMKEYLVDVLGLKEKNITVLMDDNYHETPNGSNIIDAMKDLVSYSKSGDAVYFHYSGHGGKVVDLNGDENDGYDETIIPVDYSSYGQIRDDILYKKLIGAMRSGVNLTCVMDCCHSGTVLDLPYKYVANGSSTEMVLDEDADLDILQQFASELDLEGRWLLPCIGVLLLMALLAIILWLFLRP